MGVWGASLIALFTWWFATGAILYVIRRADRTGGNAYNVAVFMSVPVLALGVAGVVVSAPDTGLTGLYAGFFGALGIWAWIELSFLSGVITGPERASCPEGVVGAPRFWRAWDALAHHEILLLAGMAFVVLATSQADNQIALWTYAILFFARISAKLNLFFGVPRINFEFLPVPLQHLRSHLRQGPITAFFPLSVTVLSFAVACFAQLLMTAETTVAATGFALLTSLSALALLEHWFMVIPLPDAKLWRWMLPEHKRFTTAKEETNGF
ncbi:putative photosynthetic complex assembly protein PuhE [Pseudooctadecabacter sp.]|uniref:putative photosynthetic complex assembly protein PuhE n=1 Tax=Pseudooctadecabacter sp. TaxID=1966338 RepID=UPI0025E79286|nr:putative photosynthetic complex assembly protein PuhE [Pseudooctadecabacter sp.]